MGWQSAVLMHRARPGRSVARPSPWGRAASVRSGARDKAVAGGSTCKASPCTWCSSAQSVAPPARSRPARGAAAARRARGLVPHAVGYVAAGKGVDVGIAEVGKIRGRATALEGAAHVLQTWKLEGNTAYFRHCRPRSVQRWSTLWSQGSRGRVGTTWQEKHRPRSGQAGRRRRKRS